MIAWVVAVTALVAAFVAWRQARRTAARLEHVSHMCWELRYQIAEIRAQLPPAPGDTPPPRLPAASERGHESPPVQAFVPLASLKR
jgi:hypothetical protein